MENFMRTFEAAIDQEKNPEKRKEIWLMYAKYVSIMRDMPFISEE